MILGCKDGLGLEASSPWQKGPKSTRKTRQTKQQRLGSLPTQCQSEPVTQTVTDNQPSHADASKCRNTNIAKCATRHRHKCQNHKQTEPKSIPSRFLSFFHTCFYITSLRLSRCHQDRNSAPPLPNPTDCWNLAFSYSTRIALDPVKTGTRYVKL